MPTQLLATLLVLGVSPDAPVNPPPPAEAVPPAAVAQLPAPPPAATGRAERIAMEVLVAGAASVGVGAVGGYLGCLASQSPDGQTCSTATIAAVGLTGYGLTLAALVPLVGNALGGNGLLWVTWLGEAAGLGGGLALAQGNATNAMLIAAPLMLVGAITGYELTAGLGPAKQSPTGVQAVTFQPVPSGLTLAVAGRF
jgi:hypothetical protein